MNLEVLNMTAFAQKETGVESDVLAAYDQSGKEYAAIRGSVAMFDFSTHGRLRISGEDHITWTSKLVSRDLEFLNSETTTFALCLNEQAEVLGIVTLYKFDDAIVIEMEPAEREVLTAWFAQHQEQGIEIEDVTEGSSLIGLEGPYAFKVVQTLLDYEVSSIAFQGFVEVEYQGETLILARTGYSGEYGYKIMVPASVAMHLYAELSRQVQELGGRCCGTDILITTMLEVRQPVNGLETTTQPVIAGGLGWLIDFNKAEDYIGKDAIMEQCATAASHRTIGFVAEPNAVIKTGAQISVDDEVIGHVLAITYSPTLHAQLGLAYNVEPFTVPDLTWDVQNEQGGTSLLRSVSSPYIVPRSWTMKML